MTYLKLEKATKISNRRLHEIVIEESPPTKSELKRLSKALGIDLMNGVGEQKKLNHVSI